MVEKLSNNKTQAVEIKTINFNKKNKAFEAN